MLTLKAPADLNGTYLVEELAEVGVIVDPIFDFRYEPGPDGTAGHLVFLTVDPGSSNAAVIAAVVAEHQGDRTALLRPARPSVEQRLAETEERLRVAEARIEKLEAFPAKPPR
jgi:hypothetical protein